MYVMASCVLCAVMRLSALAIALAVFTIGCGSDNGSTPTTTTNNATLDAMWDMWLPMNVDERATTCATFEVTPGRVIDHLAVDDLDPTKVAAFLNAWCTS